MLVRTANVMIMRQSIAALELNAVAGLMRAPNVGYPNKVQLLQNAYIADDVHLERRYAGAGE